jgi:hypothetical protein
MIVISRAAAKQRTPRRDPTPAIRAAAAVRPRRRHLSMIIIASR